MLFMSPNRRVGGTYIAFGADPIGIRVVSYLHSKNWLILTKLAQTHCWEGERSDLIFGDLDLIFKVTPAL